jgi:hypothetical protein
VNIYADLNALALGKWQVLFMNGKSKTVNLSKFGMVYYNNLLSLPICLPIAIMKGEFPQVLHSELLHGPDAQGFMMCALFSGAKRASISLVLPGAFGMLMQPCCFRRVVLGAWVDFQV